MFYTHPELNELQALQNKHSRIGLQGMNNGSIHRWPKSDGPNQSGSEAYLTDLGHLWIDPLSMSIGQMYLCYVLFFTNSESRERWFYPRPDVCLHHGA